MEPLGRRRQRQTSAWQSESVMTTGCSWESCRSMRSSFRCKAGRDGASKMVQQDGDRGAEDRDTVNNSHVEHNVCPSSMQVRSTTVFRGQIWVFLPLKWLNKASFKVYTRAENHIMFIMRTADGNTGPSRPLHMRQMRVIMV